MQKHDRRTFLKTAAGLAAASVLPSSALKSGAAWGEILPKNNKIEAWRTSAAQRFEAVSAPKWESRVPVQAMSISLDPATRYQDILGFGAAMTDASCYLLSKAPAATRDAIFDSCFGPDGLRFSVARTCIGSSDYSRFAYSFDESPTPDPELKQFTLAHDEQYILPMLRKGLATNPELFYFSSPWTPPAWMKDNDSLLGGAMIDTYMPAYANYFVKFLQGYAAAGVPIRAVTVQNETDTNQDGRMPQCEWGQEYEMHFVERHLGPTFKKEGIATKIWILDHNYDLWGRAIDELSNPLVYEYVDGVAWHGYEGSPDAMTRVHDAFPDKHAYWTEGGPDLANPDYATNWAHWSATFTGILRNWARCITSWNLVLDQNGKPDIGPFTCGGLITLNTSTQQLTHSGQYWAFAHYSKLINRGAQIIGSWGELTGISHVAAQNPDGSYVMVLTNQGGGQSVQVTLHDQAMQVDLPPDSVTTLRWV